MATTGPGWLERFLTGRENPPVWESRGRMLHLPIWQPNGRSPHWGSIQSHLLTGMSRQFQFLDDPLVELGLLCTRPSQAGCSCQPWRSVTIRRRRGLTPSVATSSSG